MSFWEAYGTWFLLFALLVAGGLVIWWRLAPKYKPKTRERERQRQTGIFRKAAVEKILREKGINSADQLKVINTDPTGEAEQTDEELERVVEEALRQLKHSHPNN